MDLEEILLKAFQDDVEKTRAPRTAADYRATAEEFINISRRNIRDDDGSDLFATKYIIRHKTKPQILPTQKVGV